MNRFDSQYKLRINDNIGDPSVLNSRFQDVDKRIGSLEDVDKTWEAAVDKLNKAGSAQVSAALGPVYAKISAFASLNTVFSARSSTEIALGEGERTFIIDEEDRAYFAPAAYIAGFVDGDLSRAWLGKPKSYDSSTGTLVVDVSRFTGVGQGANWVIHAASATDNASAALQAQQAAATATAAADSTVAAAATISDKTNLALAAAEDAVTAKQQVATDAANVASIKSDVQTMRDQVSADYKSFNERYLGPKSFDPVATNSGGALSNGLLYFNTTVGEMRTYKSAVGGWVAAYIAAPDSPVASVFGRSGPVGAADGDYNAAQIIVDPSEHITSTRVSAALEEIAAQLADKVAAATTLAGYGITDAYTKAEATDAIAAAVADKANAATTLAGYGIADSYTKAEVDAALVNLAAKATTLAGYGIADAYTKEQVTNAITAAVAGKANAATTLAGYGIADAYTRTQVDGQFSDFSVSVNNALAAKATKATTLAGYGIGDAYTKTQVDSALGGKQAALGFVPLDAAAYTAADVLTKIKSVDGAGTGLDADTVDGLHASDLKVKLLGSVPTSSGTSATLTSLPSCSIMYVNLASVKLSTSSHICIDVSDDNGASWTTAWDGGNFTMYGTAVDGDVILFNTAVAGRKVGLGVYNSANATGVVAGGLDLTPRGVINAIRIRLSAGNFQSGSVSVLGSRS